jgi:hypothetical protein
VILCQKESQKQKAHQKFDLFSQRTLLPTRPFWGLQLAVRHTQCQFFNIIIIFVGFSVKMLLNLQYNSKLGHMMLDANPEVPQELRDIAQQCENYESCVLRKLTEMHFNRKSPEEWFPLLMLWLNIGFYTNAANEMTDSDIEQPFVPPLQLPTTREKFEDAILHFLACPNGMTLDPMLSRVCIKSHHNVAEARCVELSEHPWMASLKAVVKAPLAEIFRARWQSVELEKVHFFRDESLFN